MKSAKEGKLRSMTVMIPEELHRALKVYSAEQGRTMGEVIERLINVLLHAKDPEKLFSLNTKE